jgi:hypothetical protein
MGCLVIYNVCCIQKEYEKNNCYLKEQLNERNEEIVKLTGDLKKTTRALERMTYNRQAESKEIEETIDLLKEKVHVKIISVFFFLDNSYLLPGVTNRLSSISKSFKTKRTRTRV